MSQAASAGPHPEELFRTRMREMRRALGLKQSDIAEHVSALGVPLSQPAVGMIESGKSDRISLRVAVAIAAVLDTPLEQLYQEPLDFKDWVIALEEDPEVTRSLAWLRTWRKSRLKQSTPKEGT